MLEMFLLPDRKKLEQRLSRYFGRLNLPRPWDAADATRDITVHAKLHASMQVHDVTALMFKHEMNFDVSCAVIYCLKNIFLMLFRISD